MAYIFRRGVAGDVPGFIRIIAERIKWMDAVGIEQWNKTHYFERYPNAHYEEEAAAGRLYVLTLQDGTVVAGTVLLDEDPRWGPMPQPCYYVHHLASSTRHKRSGLALMAELEALARRGGHKYLRLDCAIGNVKLNNWYKGQGYRFAGTCDDGVYHGNLMEKDVSAQPAAKTKAE